MPLDFMVDAARDAGIAFDMEGFEKARQEEQARARARWEGGAQKTGAPWGGAVLDATSFYADSGGQVGDVGWLYSADHNAIIADVSGASKPVQGVWAHRVVARQPILVGDSVDT